MGDVEVKNWNWERECRRAHRWEEGVQGTQFRIEKRPSALKHKTSKVAQAKDRTKQEEPMAGKEDGRGSSK